MSLASRILENDLMVPRANSALLHPRGVLNAPMK